MVEGWRLLDTGLASAGRNIALNRAVLEARHADEIPSTLRFLRFAPAVLLGCGQSAAEELNAAYCTAQGIAVQRRITGGSTWFVDERQLGWELYLHRREIGTGEMERLSKRVGHAAATALAALGIDPRYRARDEIECEGRLLCVLGCAAEGGGVLVQAVLFVDPNLERMTRALRSPASVALNSTNIPGPGELEAATAMMRARVVGLKSVLGRQPDLSTVRRNLTEAFESDFEIEFREGDLSLTEYARYQRASDEIETAGWVDLVSRPASNMPLTESVHRFRGGLLRTSLKYQTSTRTIRQVWFSGDVRLNPRRSLADLEAALRDLPLNRLEQQVRWFFSSRPVDSGLLEPRDFIAAVRLAAGEPLVA